MSQSGVGWGVGETTITLVENHYSNSKNYNCYNKKDIPTNKNQKNKICKGLQKL